MTLLHMMCQSLTYLLVHAIFSTKDRRPLLRSEEIRDEIYAYMAGTLKNVAISLTRQSILRNLAIRKRFAKFSNATGSPSTNAMFGIQTPKGWAPLQGAS